MGREGNRGRPSERGEGCETAEIREAGGLNPIKKSSGGWHGRDLPRILSWRPTSS